MCVYSIDCNPLTITVGGRGRGGGGQRIVNILAAAEVEIQIGNGAGGVGQGDVPRVKARIERADAIKSKGVGLDTARWLRPAYMGTPIAMAPPDEGQRT